MVDVLRQYSLHPRLAFAVVGYAAIAPLAFAYAELLPLSHGAAGVLLPAALTALSSACVILSGDGARWSATARGSWPPASMTCCGSP